MTNKRLSDKSREVLVLLRDRGDLTGADVMKITGRSSAWLYSTLYLMEDMGLIGSRWAPDAPLDRPRPRFYFLTAAGKALLKEERKS